MTVFPVILCGGSGTRLWPVSRRSHPKQFTTLLGERTLFQRTLARVRGRGLADPLLMTGADFRFVVAEQLAQMGMNASRIVVEPEARNTAPAIAMAAELTLATDPEAVLLVLPSDHVIHDEDAFAAAIRTAVEAAGERFVTFGIRPDRPETGYGYIELAGPPAAGAQPFERFVEKPDRARAEQMVASGRFLWNSGMFVFTAAAILDALSTHAPAVREAAQAALARGGVDLDFFRPDPAAYAASPDISIDYAVMERIAGMVVPIDCGWNDLGTWRTVWQEAAPNGEAVTRGGAVAIDCAETYLRSDAEDMALVGIGLERIVAVATRDAVLVADMDRAQDVRLAVDALAARGAPQATDFPRCHRPWGWYETLALGPRFQVKQIMVKPGGKLSLQSHVHRAEHWVVVAGTARVTVDGEERLLTENQSTYIALGAVHRLENPGKVPLHLIEVQSGTYLGEDDITRYEDVYARG